jgi:hypothetical protein
LYRPPDQAHKGTGLIPTEVLQTATPFPRLPASCAAEGRCSVPAGEALSDRFKSPGLPPRAGHGAYAATGDGRGGQGRVGVPIPPEAGSRSWSAAGRGCSGCSYGLSTGRIGQDSVELSGDGALQAADDLGLGLALGGPPLHLGAGGWVPGHRITFELLGEPRTVPPMLLLHVLHQDILLSTEVSRLRGRSSRRGGYGACFHLSGSSRSCRQSPQCAAQGHPRSRRAAT